MGGFPNGGSSYFDTGVTSSTINFSDLGIGTPGLGNNGWRFKVSVYNSKDNTCYVESNVATLYVVATNDCPVYNPITLSSTLKEDLDDIVLNLNSYVTDANADTVSFTNISSNNTNLVAATLSGTASLVLSFPGKSVCSAQISFDYTDGIRIVIIPPHLMSIYKRLMIAQLSIDIPIVMLQQFGIAMTKQSL